MTSDVDGPLVEPPVGLRVRRPPRAPLTLLEVAGLARRQGREVGHQPRATVVQACPHSP